MVGKLLGNFGLNSVQWAWLFRVVVPAPQVWCLLMNSMNLAWSATQSSKLKMPEKVLPITANGPRDARSIPQSKKVFVAVARNPHKLLSSIYLLPLNRAAHQATTFPTKRSRRFIVIVGHHWCVAMECFLLPHRDFAKHWFINHQIWKHRK